jgi:serine/threonine-protein kinase
MSADTGMAPDATVTPSSVTSSSDAEVQPQEAVPTLSKYDVVLKLASGGMADIFVAQRSGDEEICVIKQLHAHLSKDPIVGNRFYREARVASALDHPNIARLTDAGREGGLFYLAMEFIAGQDIETMMFRLMEQRKMLPPALSVSATLKVLEGLHHAHEFREPESNKHLEIVHRDLSPRNVMITYTGKVKIIDFGLARTNLGDFRTAPGMVLGTLRYMSPEQAVAEPVDRRSDIYTWSVVLYEMLSGRPLVMGANAHEVLHAVVTQMPKPLSALNPYLPKALDRVLEKGLAKDRRDRFETAHEFKEALQQAAEGLRANEEQIGRFVSDLFPDECAKTMAMLEAAQRGEYCSYEPTRYDSLHDVTRVATIIRDLGDAPIVPATLPPAIHELAARPFAPSTSPAITPLTSPIPGTLILPRHRKQARWTSPPVILGVAFAAVATGALAFTLSRNQSEDVITIASQQALAPQAAPAPTAQRVPAAHAESLPVKTVDPPPQRRGPVKVEPAVRAPVQERREVERTAPKAVEHAPQKEEPSSPPPIERPYARIERLILQGKRELNDEETEPRSLLLAADEIAKAALDKDLPNDRHGKVDACMVSNVATQMNMKKKAEGLDKCLAVLRGK